MSYASNSQEDRQVILRLCVDFIRKSHLDHNLIYMRQEKKLMAERREGAADRDNDGRVIMVSTKEVSALRVQLAGLKEKYGD